MDLTQEELVGIVDLASAAEWADLDDAALKSLMEHMGAKEATRLRTVAAIHPRDYGALLDTWRIQAGEDWRWPTAIERAAATNFGDVIRFKMRWSASARAQTSQTGVKSPIESRVRERAMSWP